MKTPKTSFFLRAAFAALALLGTAGCDSAPESFCSGWVSDTCDAIAGCCKGGAKYDRGLCVVELSSYCEEATRVEDVHAGGIVFDSGAASDCFPSVDSCEDVGTANDPTFEQSLACNRMISGFRPVGAACQDDDQCVVAGEYGACYQGGGGLGGGICAEVEIAEGSCGFDVETNILTVCGDQQYCDVSAWVPDASKSPAVQAFEIKGTCKPFLDVGSVCEGAGVDIPCKKGLYCDFGGGGPDAVCQQEKGAGELCNSSNECQPDLDCDFNGTDFVCMVTTVQEGGPFCYVPPVCGDGVCGFGENQSCAQDCGQQGFCGDLICEGNEPEFCPEDCELAP